MPEAAKDRVWERLEASLAADDENPFELVSVKRPRATRIAAVLALAAAAVLAIVAVKIGVDTIEHKSPRDSGSEAVYGHTSSAEVWGVRARGHAQRKQPWVPVTTAATASEPVEDEPELPEEGNLRPRQDTLPGPDRARPPEQATPAPPVGEPRQEHGDTNSLVEETRALARAQQALADGEPDRALGLLEACARTFPGGVLVEERSALRVVALCESGKTMQARGEARLFHQRYPTSALSARVRRACPVAP